MRRVGTGIKGIAEVVARLRGIKREAFERAAAEVMEPSAYPFVESAKASLSASNSIMTKALHDSIGVVVRVRPKKRMIFVVIGPRSGFERKDDRGVMHNPVKYAHLIEWGVKPHELKTLDKKISFTARFFGVTSDKDRTTQHPGFKPRPFVRPAWDAYKGSALGDISVQIGNLAERIAYEKSQEKAGI